MGRARAPALLSDYYSRSSPQRCSRSANFRASRGREGPSAKQSNPEQNERMGYSSLHKYNDERERRKIHKTTRREKVRVQAETEKCMPGPKIKNEIIINTPRDLASSPPTSGPCQHLQIPSPATRYTQGRFPRTLSSLPVVDRQHFQTAHMRPPQIPLG